MTGPALLVAGTHSGCGKTTVALGVMAALARRGLAVQPFKCGPDFIDPSLHRMVAGRVSRNLDIRMCGVDWVRRTFVRHAQEADVAVIEGVMGLFDGGEGSAATLAKTLDLPVLLVVDARSAAESVAAVVHGFATLDAGVRLVGVICNGIGSDRHREMVEEAIGGHCAAPVLGCLPRSEAVTIPSRHLGLHMGEEHPLTGKGLERLIELIEAHVDLPRLLRLAAGWRQEESVPEAPAPTTASGTPVRIGLARDAAFCFYYEDNLDLLRAAGAELVLFSPLDDDRLPPGLNGLYLGGGYPELHARRLSDNRAMREQVRAFAESGRPVYGECGGFMYLCRSITDLNGGVFPMAGLYPFAARMQTRLRSLGYRRPQVVRDCLLGPAGTVLHGHEFHYSTIETEVETVPAAYELEAGQPEGFLAQAATLASYVHLHWGRTPAAAAQLVAACRSKGDNSEGNL
ncbi:MAG: cobyrinate a,c-diamide synthase [Desulfobulbus sp.]|nr:cobyrinate a,c-diamide synthase [Desulfobulbus sp.]